MGRENIRSTYNNALGPVLNPCAFSYLTSFREMYQQRTGSYVPEYLHSQHHAGPWHAMGELVSLQPPLVSWQHSRLEFRIIGHAATRGHEPGLLQRRLRLK